MLNIPPKVRALYLQDSIRKYMQVYFPNGEADRLRNIHIAAESVQFTESICSEEYFRFGLAERSVIEFECTDYPNMQGMVLQVYHEINIRSLTNQEIADIEAGTWDGEVIRYQDGSICYRISLGEFVVDSCPVENDYNLRRTLKAYTPDYFNVLNDFELCKLSVGLPATGWTYQPLIVPLVMAQLASKSAQPLIDEGFTYQNIGYSGGNNYLFTGIKVSVENNSGQKISFSMKSARRSSPYMAGEENAVHIVEYNKENVRTWLKNLDDYLATLDINYAAGATIEDSVTTQISGPEDLRMLIGRQYQYYNGVEYSTGAQKSLFYDVLLPYVYYKTGENGTGRTTLTEAIRIIDTANGASGYMAYSKYGFFAADGTMAWKDFTTGSVYFPRSYDLSVINETTGTTTTHSDTVNALTRAYMYITPQNYPMREKRLYFEPNGDELNISSWTDTFQIGKLLNDYLEARARFAAPARPGAARIFQLQQQAQETVDPSHYATLLVDEHNGELPGLVRFKAANGTKQTLVDFRFGNGLAVYDMSDNDVFVELGMSQAEIKAFLTTYFVPYVQNLALNAADAVMVGMPWVEPGDKVRFQRPDGTTVDIYLTRRQMRGPQMLQDQAEAVRTQTGND